MTNSRKLLLGLIGLFILTALPMAQAQNGPPDEGDSPKIHEGGHIQDIFNQLNLSDDQKKQLQANKQQHRSKTESARAAMKVDKQAMREELMKPQLDMSKINGLHQQIKALQSQMEDDKLNSILAVRAILTPQQFSEFVNLMHKHKQVQGQ